MRDVLVASGAVAATLAVTAGVTAARHCYQQGLDNPNDHHFSVSADELSRIEKLRLALERIDNPAQDTQALLAQILTSEKTGSSVSYTLPYTKNSMGRERTNALEFFRLHSRIPNAQIYRDMLGSLATAVEKANLKGIAGRRRGLLGVGAPHSEQLILITVMAVVLQALHDTEASEPSPEVIASLNYLQAVLTAINFAVLAYRDSNHSPDWQMRRDALSQAVDKAKERTQLLRTTVQQQLDQGSALERAQLKAAVGSLDNIGDQLRLSVALALLAQDIVLTHTSYSQVTLDLLQQGIIVPPASNPSARLAQAFSTNNKSKTLSLLDSTIATAIQQLAEQTAQDDRAGSSLSLSPLTIIPADNSLNSDVIWLLNLQRQAREDKRFAQTELDQIKKSGDDSCCRDRIKVFFIQLQQRYQSDQEKLLAIKAGALNAATRKAGKNAFATDLADEFDELMAGLIAMQGLAAEYLARCPISEEVVVMPTRVDTLTSSEFFDDEAVDKLSIDPLAEKILTVMRLKPTRDNFEFWQNAVHSGGGMPVDLLCQDETSFCGVLPHSVGLFFLKLAALFDKAKLSGQTVMPADIFSARNQAKAQRKSTRRTWLPSLRRPAVADLMDSSSDQVFSFVRKQDSNLGPMTQLNDNSRVRHRC